MRTMFLASIKLAAKVAPHTRFFEVSNDLEMSFLMAFFDPFVQHHTQLPWKKVV